MNIFEALRDDHEKQRDLVRSLTETSGDSDERRQRWKWLRQELEDHAAAEERFFYRPLMEHDQTMDKARHSVHEHQQIDEKIEEIEKTDFSSPGWLTLVKSLGELVEHHLDEEEHEVFQMAGKVLNEKQKQDLADAYKDDIMRRRAE